MNLRKFIYHKKINIAKFLMISCIFLLSIIFSTSKIDALNNINILESTYTGNGNNKNAVEINDIVYIQGSGISNKDGIKFQLSEMYENLTDFTAFAVWEQGYSETSELKDYDRWYIRSVTCSDVNTCPEWETVKSEYSGLIMLDSSNNPIIKNEGFERYYITKSSENVNSSDVETIVDFSKFFSDAMITYTYRIRNLNYYLSQDGFGYKEIYINYWKANDGSDFELKDALFTTPVTIQYGLAKAIDDAESYTNHNEQPVNNLSLNCNLHSDAICVEYADTNGTPSASTTVPRETNIYLPKNVIYSHASTTRIQVNDNLTGDNKIDINYIKNNNTLYAYNYFCEGNSIQLANITWNNGEVVASCNAGESLRQYAYVEAKLLNNDINSTTTFVNQQKYFIENTYNVSLEVDTRGNYVLFIRDVFGNVNKTTVFKVMDIINQALIAYFQKSNHTNELYEVADGWKANEYLTNEDVQVIITMSATTVIEKGLPIIEAETTLLDSSYIKEIKYWRVDGDEYTSDICNEGEKNGCAIKPSDAPSSEIYNKPATSNQAHILYSKPQGQATADKGDGFIKFEANSIYLNISSNGRYRFYIETYPGNNTDTNEGEKKNPRVEVYKIDMNAPEILFGSNKCSENCSYSEETYMYYQGSGNPSGTIVSNMVNQESDFKISYSKDGIYYLSANNQDVLSGSASSIEDVIYTYMYALYNSKTYLREVLSKYDGSVIQYDHFYATGVNDNNVSYGLDFNILESFKKDANGNDVSNEIYETKYREYIISSNIKFTAFSLASNPVYKDSLDQKDVSTIEIEYYDAKDTNSLVCNKVTLDVENETNCVNYYLDHGIDFKIKITIYDIVQDSNGNYILGNSNSNYVTVNVIDTTAPGFSKEIQKYNVGSECRIEVGTKLDRIAETMFTCYGIKDSDGYNFEDNVFDSNNPYVYNQTINNLNYIELYLLGKDGKWHSLKEEYTPSRSGDYALLVIIRDASSVSTTFELQGQVYHDIASSENITVEGNALATIISYKVDKRIVIVTPTGGSKTYGENDPSYFEYSVSINGNTSGIREYLEAPFKDMSVFNVTVSTNNGILSEESQNKIFSINKGIAIFTGNLTRQESSIYNGPDGQKFGKVSNDYVGVYKIVLGTLNISAANGVSEENKDIGNDYIIKINPSVRNTEYQLATIEGNHRSNGTKKCNLVDSQVDPSDNSKYVSGCYSFTEDDDFFVESSATFTIKQAILTVSATGASKIYGDTDPNSNRYNIDSTLTTNGYLNGYTISGLKYSDTNNVVKGVLRREVGENVGSYLICNYRGDTLNDNELESKNNMLVISSSDICSKYLLTIDENGTYENGILKLDEDTTKANNYIKSRALYITTNKVNGLYKTLNTTTDNRNNNYANYVINFIATSGFKITPATMIVQPTPGQRREYSYNGVDEVNPWEILMFGEKTWEYNALEDFKGYTTAAPSMSASENDSQSVDLGSPNSGVENYNNASENRENWKLIYNNVLYENGKKTNETYSIFTGRISLIDWVSEGGVFKNMNAGWYSFNELTNSSLSIVTNGRKQCVYENYLTSVNSEASDDCRNYDLILDLNYRNDEGYKNGDTDASGNSVQVVYKSKDKYCRTTSLGSVSDSEIQCSEAQSSQILFEVYRREIILEFNSLLEKINVDSSEIDLVYGKRYDYYKNNLFSITTSNDASSEGYIFYCYSSYENGIVTLNQGEGNCTNNKWVGLTEGDTWSNIGLEFHLHSQVSDTSSPYYDTDTDKAIPAGRYYVYSSISENGKKNYKFNYLGGTLTIKTLSVGVELTSYNKEYGNVYYKEVTCLKDGSFLNGEGLISDCEDTTNTINNTYGFVINGLDLKDEIAQNFIGRPRRLTSLVTSTDVNGLQENVGVYAINIGSVHSKNNNPFLLEPSRACNDNFLPSESSCVVVNNIEINNYIISNDSDYELTYYLLKNGTLDNEKNYSSRANLSIVNSDDRTLNSADLTITPSRIEITLTPNQTKMYGCAYNKVNTNSNYNYSYTLGYDCIENTGTNYDYGYEYTVKGDKDYYIYNNGYYETNYNSDTTYTVSKINSINNNMVINELLITGSKNVGLRSSALNNGVLYRISFDKYTGEINYQSLIEAANKGQTNTYQGQSVGSYIITLGNLDATLNSNLSNYNETYSKVCNQDNEPGKGTEICKNYIIEYYENTSIDNEHTYSKDVTQDTTFTITPRVAFIYTKYNSKVYGNADPIVTSTCNELMISEGLCKTNGEVITYGVSYYYTKYNSLAKAPWVASIEVGDNIYYARVNDNDVQTDIVNGSLSRVGMNNNEKSVDDIVGTYNYLFDNVATTSYAYNNYKLNYYYRNLKDNKIEVINGEINETENAYILDISNHNQKQAVNENGGIVEVVEGEEKNVIFEITRRKITVTLISFSKVYGIEDNSSYYDLGICATGDQTLSYDSKGNPICIGNSESEHGLSPSHKANYVDNTGVLLQNQFKTDFGVKFLRSKGENVSCNSTLKVTGTLQGFFTNREETYNYDLDCNNQGYEAIGVIDQSSETKLGYNYEITYVEGIMKVVPRRIMITPDSNQGFQYGSYTNPSLIPAISFSTGLINYDYSDTSQKVVSYYLNNNEAVVTIINRDGSLNNTGIIINNLGLVNNGNDKICLKNINGVDNFCINDRQDTYNEGEDEASTSSFSENIDGSVTSPTYVFGDNYQSEASARSALNRKLSDSHLDERYNRNVGVYAITQGDLLDKSGNYSLAFSEGVEYKITPASVKITPDSNQSKTYGESDKELTFSVITTYQVNNDQYVTNDTSIASIKDKEGNDISVTGTKIKVTKGSTITLNGFAYYENNNSTNYNYGSVKNSNKSGFVNSGINQEGVIGKSYDKYCYDNYNDNSNSDIGSISGCNNQNISFASSNLVLIGYLYVENYKQNAGVHKIVNGFVVSNNELGNKNYEIEFVDTITFEIIKLDINLIINDINKNYGQASDKYKCDEGIECLDGFATLLAQDNEDMLEYNFDVKYKGKTDKILQGTYNGELKVLLVHAINGNYYTQSEGEEDKNNFLGVSVIRKNNNDTSCTISSDRYGCEDVGVYDLVLRKVSVDNDYDKNYNLIYNDSEITINEVNNEYVIVDPKTHNIDTSEKVNIIGEIRGSLTINKKEIDIFVNTNLNSSSANYYEIEQNIEAPSLPTINNSYNLINYNYDANKEYHGLGENASSSSSNTDLDSTYTKIVWGTHPSQVRTKDALVGELAYCNEASNGELYSSSYPLVNTLCSNKDKLVYNQDKKKVNTNTKDKFIIMTRDTTSNKGLKILSSFDASNVNNNDYEEKNYTVNFYSGAIHVIGDSSDPNLVIANKDYYLEANAKKEGNTIVGSNTSIGTILEYLFNGEDNYYILANVDDNGNLYITVDNTKIVISQSSLVNTYGINSDSYLGIVSGVEQSSVRPFVSNYAHITMGNSTYLNETNIKLLEELITTLVEWFKVSSYDDGQVINGEYLERKFDRYYYVAINKNGYDIASNINNQFAINKVGSYTLSFYVMDNSGRVSKDGNNATLHIIDTTSPNQGELTLYNAEVKCDTNCNNLDQWYIKPSKVRLASFNKYTQVVEGEVTRYVLDSEGEYIYYAPTGGGDYYRLISELEEEGIITLGEDNIKYINTDYTNVNIGKISALGIIHYTWNGNPDGIFLTITGGSDNSYTDETTSENSQWSYYYSLTGGTYWINYVTSNDMSSYSALISDGTREISVQTLDNGVGIEVVNTEYSVTYNTCYNNCKEIEIINKVNIKGSIYTINQNNLINKSFDYDSSTRCEINLMGTVLTCITQSDDGEIKNTFRIEGNRVTITLGGKSNNYIITQDYLLDAGGTFSKEINPLRITIEGITYEYDREEMRLYNKHIGKLTNLGEQGIQMILDGNTYIIKGSEVLLDGSIKKAEIENGKFTLDGLDYNYMLHPGNEDGYYLAIETYNIYQDSIKINGTGYNISSFVDNKLKVGSDELILTQINKYTNSYKQADKYLISLEEEFVDDTPESEEGLLFRNRIIANVKWNKANTEIELEEAIKKEISMYIYGKEDVIDNYYKDIKIAYLDTKAPTLGTRMTTVIDNNSVIVRYGEEWYVYEYGYFNTLNLSSDKKYSLGSITYTIDIDNLKVKDSENNSYNITITNDSDTSKKYVYRINYTDYYINEEVSAIKWLKGYSEKFVGAKDEAKKSPVSAAEAKRYQLNSSIFMGEITEDSKTHHATLIDKTYINLSSGIGGDKYSQNGQSDTLYDFVYLGQYENGIYYDDIDYIVYYIDESNNSVRVELDDEFKECYLKDGKIIESCAQDAIQKVIKAPSKDTVYTINYVVRDKAGNASSYVARGVLYASILPTTNVVINNIAATSYNSEISVVNEGNNTYSLRANQGVSLDLLNQAFSINYASYYKSYNDDALMTIYQEDEVIVSNVKGVKFTDYLNSDSIGNYKVVYTMNSSYQTYLGDEIALNGDTITLKITIKSPVLNDNSDIVINDFVSNESNIILVIGFIGMFTLLGVYLFLKKKH